MADNYKVLDGTRALLTLAAKQIGDVLFPKHIIVGPDGSEQDLLAALKDMAPATDVVPVTPSDAAALSGVRAIFVGTGGNLVITINGNNVTLPNIPDGTTLPIKGATRIRAATTASDISVFK